MQSATGEFLKHLFLEHSVVGNFDLHTATLAGRMVFTILGAVAELERSLIVERVKAGLRNARAKGKRLGRPRVFLDRSKVVALRAEGLSWADSAERLGVGEGTVYWLAHAQEHTGEGPRGH